MYSKKIILKISTYKFKYFAFTTIIFPIKFTIYRKEKNKITRSTLSTRYKRVTCIVPKSTLIVN